MANARTTLSVTLITLLCFCHCVFSANVVSGESAPALSITFLDIEAGKAAIMDTALDSYFGQLQPMEMSAKTGSSINGQTLDEQRAQCRKRYQSEVRQFADDEKKVLRSCIEKLTPVLRETYPRFAAMPWSFLKVSNKIEGGLPHTQGKHIILCERMCRGLASRYKTAPDRTVLSITGLMIHEQMHVFQRVNPTVFDSLYTELWGFIKAVEIESCPWLEKHHLVNPDGLDCCWVFPIGQDSDTRYILPLVVFAEGEGLKQMPRDFRLIAVELVRRDGHFRPKVGEDGKPAYRNLHDVQEYRKVFPSTGNIYHPNEACASLFTAHVMADFRNRQGSTSQGGRARKNRVPEPLRQWFSRNLGVGPSRTGP